MCGKCMTPWLIMPPGAGPASMTKPSSTSDLRPSWRWGTRPGPCSTRRAGQSGDELLPSGPPQVQGRPAATGMDPEAERRFKLSHSIDGTQYAQAPAATCTEEVRMRSLPSAGSTSDRRSCRRTTRTMLRRPRRPIADGWRSNNPPSPSRSFTQRRPRPSAFNRRPFRASHQQTSRRSVPNRRRQSGRRRRTRCPSYSPRSWHPSRRACSPSQTARWEDLLRKVNLMDFKAA